MENPFGHLTLSPEEEEVTRQQISEDTALFGNRPCPPEFYGVDEPMVTSGSPAKRSAAEIDAATDRAAKHRREHKLSRSNSQNVTAIDWNSGATPLDAWLNQSAVPSTAPALLPSCNSENSNLKAKELEDLKSFRTIHIENSEEPKSSGTVQNSHIINTTLEPSTQVYFRNILDRYPLLPSYLVLRLAEANSARAHRLKFNKRYCGDLSNPESIQISGQGHRKSQIKCNPADEIAQGSKSSGRPQYQASKTDRPRPFMCSTCNRFFSRRHHLTRHMRSHAEEGTIACEQCPRWFYTRDLLLRHEKRDHKQNEGFYYRTPSERTDMDFWTGRGFNSRAASVKSQSTERNSSLHGSDQLDPEDRSSPFPEDRSRRASATFSDSSSAFPPPPVSIELENSRLPDSDDKKKTSRKLPMTEPLRFFCDICDEEIEVLRRRDWQ